MNCELCVAINDTSRVVEIEEHCFSLVPTCPLKKGHVMVLPTRHVTNLAELQEQEAKEMLFMLGRLKHAFLSHFKDPALIVMNTGDHSSQCHLHFHILPSKGGFRNLISNFENVAEREPKSQEEMSAMCDTIKSLLP